MHRGGHDSSAGAMGPSPSEGGAGGSSNHPVGPGGRRCHMPVHDGTMDDQEGGEGATATEGGKDRRAGRSVGSRRWQRRCQWVWGRLRRLYYDGLSEAGEGHAVERVRPRQDQEVGKINELVPVLCT